jgi:coatomer protein complex subunit epsilon
MAEEFDELHIIKNNFYAGNYPLVINDTTNPSTPQGRLEKQCLIFRSLIALRQYQKIIEEVNDNHPEEFCAIKLLAQYLFAKETNNSGNIENVLNTINNVLSNSNTNPIVILMFAIIYNYEEMVNEALQILENVKAKNLECTAFYIQLLIKINRTDLAQKEVSQMKSWADDAALAQLAETWLNLALGGDRKYQESFYIFEELSQSINSVTPKLLTGKAICKMHASNFAEAEKLLLESLNQNSNDPDTLVNLIICSRAQGKPEELVNKYIM